MIYVNLALLATSLCVGLIYASDWILQLWFETNSVTIKTDSISATDQTELKDLVTDLNQLIGKVDPLLKKPVHSTADLVSIIQATPTDIKLHSLRLDYTTKALEISGTATSRDTAVAYQQALSGIAGVSNVKLPFGDLNQKEAITFSINAKYETPPTKANP
jgi:hypothetical protein